MCTSQPTLQQMQHSTEAVVTKGSSTFPGPRVTTGVAIWRPTVCSCCTQSVCGLQQAAEAWGASLQHRATLCCDIGTHAA